MAKRFILKDKFNLTLKNSDIITLILESSKLDIHYELIDGDYDILVFNNSNLDVILNETGVIKNANVKITYIELNNHSFNQNNSLNVYEDSNLDINSIYLGINNKNIKFDVYNKGLNSNVFINNNVVCLNDANLTLNVIGNIEKGAKHSKCIQKSRCLTFETPKKAKVLPILNIDENDVEAAHSLSSGTIDEEILFYMNARGLSKKDALSLLLVSYLMPNDKFYEPYENGAEIKNIADKKVEDLCLI